MALAVPSELAITPIAIGGVVYLQTIKKQLHVFPHVHPQVLKIKVIVVF